MKLDSDDFELFGVARQFLQDRVALDARWRALQAEVHPDRFVAQGAAAQRVAMQWAVRVNEAYQRLKDPLRRAAYLCELSGAPIQAENNTAMPARFLIQQMAWREALDDAESVEAVDALQGDVARQRGESLQRLHTLIDIERNFADAAAEERALMFVERFAADVDRRLEQLGQ